MARQAKKPDHRIAGFKEEEGLAKSSVGKGEADEVEIDPLLDRTITRKFDRHIVPWLFGLWLFAFIDRRYPLGLRCCCRDLY